MFTVSVYFVSRLYGGPEEGGWWYNAGYPDPEHDRFAALFHSRERADSYAIRLRRRLLPILNKGRRDLGSVLSQGVFQVHVDEGFPAKFPEETPHYE